MDIQTGDPTEDGRYVVWTPCAARQIAEWCEPSLQTWQGGRWHHGEPVTCWIGPLPVVHSKTGEIDIPVIVATDAAGALAQMRELWPEGPPELGGADLLSVDEPMFKETGQVFDL